ncbi:MAG TPA: ParB/RepB/Spo0J family partition protein [Solirubrobacteraceae bacterium]|nr:ParB/RepB/Spo0J family partition protein [Solirubrobacteraceae bacterium]
MATCTENPTTAARPKVTFGEIPLSKITVAEGFNPRGEVLEDTELQQMAATMRERGCLQPIRVRAVEDTGEFVLIAGERRYRAAALAALTQIPAAIVGGGSGDEAEYLDLLTEAMIENESRSDLDPVQRAHGYQAMIDGGLSVRGVAERLGGKTKRGSREKRIKEHLLILQLPERLRSHVADQTIPMFAVKTLVELAEIHEDLANAALTGTAGAEYETYSWQDVVDQPINVAVNCIEELPTGVYATNSSYPIAQFSLNEKASKDLLAYSKLTGGGEITAVRFVSELLQPARLLGAVRDAGWFSLIVGQDVASRLAEDYIAWVLKEARARDRREKARVKANISRSDAADAARDASEPDGPASRADEEPSEADQAAAQRTAAQAEREQATKFNLELGVLAFKHLPKLKVDERLLRILASVDLSGTLGKIASRGARLTLPTWVEEKQQRNKKMKMVYLDTWEAERRATSFLEGANGAGEIAGRAFTLIALASLADERAIAQSNRSFYTLTFDGPWATQAERDLNAIVRERIKEGQCEALDLLLAERIAKDEAEAEIETHAAEARARAEEASTRISELTEEQLDQLLEDAETGWGKFSIDRTRVLQAITADRERRVREEQAAEESSPSDLAQAA